MKVCHFIGTSIKGQYFQNIAESLPSNGVELIFIGLRDTEEPTWLRNLPGVKFYGLASTSKKMFPQAAVRLGRILKKEKVDILHVHLFEGGIVGIPAARMARVRHLVYTRHHSDLVHRIGKNYHIWIDRWTAKRSEKVIAVSDAVKKFMVESDFIASKKIEVVHLGFNFSKSNPSKETIEKVRSELGLENKLVIGCIASFHELKGHKYLIAAFEKIVRKYPESALLLLGGGKRDELIEYISNLGLTERVVFGGYREDVTDCIGAMDLVVHPSLSEAFSQVIIEVMGVGTAIVATDVGGAREVIEHGINAMLISPANSKEIEETVDGLLASKSLRQEIGEKGKSSVREKFTVDRMNREHLRIYNELMNQ